MYLKDFFFDNPKKFLSIVFDKNPNEIIRKLWNGIKEIENIQDTINPDLLSLDAYRISEDHLMCMITMPKPIYSNEAYYICIVVKLAPKSSEIVKTYYYTLERTFNNTAVICGWNNNSHFYTGQFIAPNMRVFGNEIIKRLGLTLTLH
jgi:hypothetical protein